ncbi:Glutathione S-transferase [Quillaja saponaria]|uniref:Glutathione S-transferase n=1 Tax=Quillaja saponaria TaxID=32244 RepID=A0AAD7LCD7_QUISA|nr:Glutathione S-transferase [Quillaja saponaria]
MEEVKLLGFWPSPFSHRVIWSLKLKGIKYEYIEEDVSNKSQLLLQSNPVHKKVPVLFHNGNSIAESTVILEFIEETWPENPLLPRDAYQRALARFWIKFGEDEGLIIHKFFVAIGGEREKAAKEILEVLKILEQQGLKENKFFGGNTIGLVDISYGWLAHWFLVTEEIVGVKVIEPSKLPLLHAWVKNFKDIPVIKDNLPDYEKLVVHMKSYYYKLLFEVVDL